jgi:hypothetical protein
MVVARILQQAVLLKPVQTFLSQTGRYHRGWECRPVGSRRIVVESFGLEEDLHWMPFSGVHHRDA